MNIGFDAKRAFHNGTGLGHYSRTLIRSLSQYYNEHEYYLFNPKPAAIFEINGNNIHEILPDGLINKLFSSAWRSSWVKKDLKKYEINLYHGLSHEIPIGIQQTDVKSVVTIHDLIHERYPQQYNAVDVKIYNKKFRYACNNKELLKENKYADAVRNVIEEVDKGRLRVASPTDKGWQVNEWIKQAILLYFNIQPMKTWDADPFEFYDKMLLKKKL